ncbi:MAG: hypothetical protein M1594_00500 [Candidatus Marsarchaeota archaeon]|nr:hypothetical protein [Candidatus Marsarchaeota archaeon]
MVCYVIPLASAIALQIGSKNKNAQKWWLILMLYGGAVFGIIDHIWNGELFLISGNILSDLLLGLVITITIVISWSVFVLIVKNNPKLSNQIGY